MRKSIFSCVGGAYKDFVVTKRVPLEELQSVLLELTHRPSGARIIHIENEDPENLFSLSFRTYPSNSNGVAHILEHTVLCGSKKFPVKDPFFAMTRRSLHTFMNAFTGQDFTCYPASSQVEKDFYNLLEVYLDAVFHPLLKKLSFLQEGHRLEFTEPANPESPLQFQGVVFNEMKGSLTSSESRLWREVFKHLVPDLPYANNTGGDPTEIPTLTHEELLEFHRIFYHPSQCLFFFYGNIPLERHLDCIEKNALAGVKKTVPIPPLARQERFKAPICRKARYPISPTESLEKKTVFAFGWLTTSVTHQREILALSLLDIILMDNDASLLRCALLQSGLCTQAGSSLDTEMSEAAWLFICKGCESRTQEKLKEVLFKTLQEISEKPIAEELVQSALHQLEFDRTEINTDEGPFGLVLFMRAALIAQHGSDPENGLLIHTLFNELRENLKDPSYLPFLIKHFLLNNSHHLQLMLEADPHLEKEELEEEKERLKIRHSSMTPQDVKTIIEQSKALAAYQEETEHQSLDCLPKVSLSDVPTQIRRFALTESVSGRAKIFHHRCFTNQILYADLIFDLPHIEEKDLSLASLLSRFITELGCGGKDYKETLRRSQAFTGGMSASLNLHISAQDPNRCHPSFSIKGKALSRHGEELFSLFYDFFSTPDLSDTARIKELLSQQATGLQNRLSKSAMNYATQTSLASFSIPSFVCEQCHGLSYYQAVLQWIKNPHLLIENLKRLREEILGRGELNIVLSCDEAQFSLLEKNHFHNIGSTLPHRPLKSWTGNYTLPNIPSQARFIASPVAFSALGMRTVSYRDGDAPFLLLAAELLENVVLHKEIREKGGAYGANASYTPTTGNFCFSAYRDPHLAKTMASFQKSLDIIADKKFTEAELEEAKFGTLQSLDAPIAPGSRAMTAYAWQRAGRTDAMREEFRKTLLSASREEVSEAVKKCLLNKESVFVSYLGEALFEKEKKKMKMPLSVLPLS